MEGVGLGESPRWHEGRLWFSDWVAGEVVALDTDGAYQVMAKVDAFPFSIDWLPDGPLLITAGPRLLRMEPDGSLVTHADLGELNDGWNEIVVDGRGNTYVNGAGFDLMSGGEFAPGLIALLADDGSARQMADGIAFPNGMAITPDGSTLIVADSYGKDGIQCRRRREPLGTPNLGRPGGWCPGWDLHRRRGGGLVRGRAESEVHTSGRGR
jgi:sugar lactone lactonase YvrE